MGGLACRVPEFPGGPAGTFGPRVSFVALLPESDADQRCGSAQTIWLRAEARPSMGALCTWARIRPPDQDLPMHKTQAFA